MANELRFEVSALDRTAKALDKVAMRLDKLSSKLDKLDRKSVNVKVDVDTKGALGKVDAFAKRAAKRIDKLSNDVVGRAGLIRTAVVGALAALPLAAQVASVGVVAAFGLAFATIGVIAAATNDDVKTGWQKLAGYMHQEAIRISEPFVAAMKKIQAVAIVTFDAFAPALERAYKKMGPATATFVERVALALQQLIPAIAPVAAAFSKVLPAIGTALIPVFSNISRELSKMSVVVEQNATAFADLIGWVLQIIPVALRLTTWIAKMTAEHQTLTKALLLAPAAFLAYIGVVAILDKAIKAFAVTTTVASGSLKVFQTVVLNARVALTLLGVSATAAKLSLGAIGVALAIAGAAVAVFVARNHEAKQAADSFRQTLNASTGALTMQSREFVFNELKADGATKAAAKLGVSQKDLVNAALGNEGALRRVNAVTGQYNTSLEASRQRGAASAAAARTLKRSLGEVQRAVADGRREFELARAAQVNDAIASSGLSEAQQKLARAQADVEETAKKQEQALKLVIDAMTQLSNLTISVSQSNIQYQQTLDDTAKTLKENGKGLDLDTKKGRENRAALNGIVTAMNARIDAAARAGASQERLDKIQANGIVQWAKFARAAGMSTKAIDAYIKKNFGIPTLKVTKLELQKDRAENNLAKWKRQLKDPNLTKERRAKIQAKIDKAEKNLRKIQRKINGVKGKTVTITINSRPGKMFVPKGASLHDIVGATGGRVERGRIRRFADGGFNGPVRGPGGPTSDMVPAMLSNGEFVVRAATVRKLGVGFFDAINRMRNGGVVGLAAGGPAAAAPAGPSTGAAVAKGMAAKSKDPVKAAQELAKRVTKVYQGADGWLTKDGKGIVTGLAQGVRGQGPVAAKAAKDVSGRVRGVYKPAGSWLKPPGRSVVHGLATGMRAAMPSAHKATTSGVNGVLDRWSKLRNTRNTARYVVNNVMAVLVKRFNTVAKSFGAKSASVPHFRDGGYVKPRRLASGGMVEGPGGPRDDKIPAMLSNGEFVVNAEATRKNLGLLKALNKYKAKPKGDPIPEFQGAPHLKDGGLVSDKLFFDPMDWYRDKAKPVLAKLGNLSNTTFNNAMKKAPPKLVDAAVKKIKKLYDEFGVGNVAAGLRFAQRQDGKPYSWGAVGPRAYDCSGLWSAVTRVIQGYRNPHQRMFTTSSFGGGSPAGFRRGAKSNAVVGVNPGSHMAGTILLGNRRWNIEAGGTSGGAGVNGRAGGAWTRSWAGRWGLTRGGGTKRAMGGMLNANEWAKVGEHGPEMIRLRHPGRVFSTPQSQRLQSFGGSGGSGGTTNVYVKVEVPVSANPAEVGKAVVGAIKTYQRSTGGAPIDIKVRS